MPWITPKTDWKAEYDAVGIYQGDFFNVEDYNRIKNNLEYLREMGRELASGISDDDLGLDKHIPVSGSPDFDNDNYFADEFNKIENVLKSIDDAIGINHGDPALFYENGSFIDYVELNRIERAELDLYNYIEPSVMGKLRLAMRLGERSNSIRV